MNVDDLVRRFGFPEEPDFKGDHLAWEYKSSEYVPKRPNRVTFKIVNGHVVEIVGFHK